MSKSVKKNGFTLVELVIVIAVIAVLAAILIPTFSGIIGNAKITKYKASVNSMNTNLVTEATANGIDYYTASGVKNFLISKEFDIEGVPEGYTLWFDQSNFNLKLIEDTETLKKVQDNFTLLDAGVSSNSLIDSLPSRPEAVTSDPNLLLISTNEENKAIEEAIEAIYDLGNVVPVDEPVDEPVGEPVGDPVAPINERLSSNDIRGKILSVMGDSNNVWVDNYLAQFSTERTIYVSSTGDMFTAEIGEGVIEERSNVVVAPGADITIKGFHETFTGEVKLTCAFELPDNVKGIGPNAFSWGFSDDTLTVIIPTRIDSSLLNLPPNVVVLQPNRGSEILDNVKYENTDFEIDKDYRINRYDYYSVASGGFTVYAGGMNEEQLANWWDAVTAPVEGKPLLAKYAVPSIEFLFKKDDTDDGPHFSLSDLESITVRETSYGDYKKIIAIATYWDEGVLKGTRFDEGVGYLTNAYDYVTGSDYIDEVPSDDGASAGDVESGATTVSGTTVVEVKLPQGVYGLSGFELENLQVKVFYKDKITYYDRKETDFGTVYYENTGVDVVGNTKDVTLNKPANTSANWKKSITQGGITLSIPPASDGDSVHCYKTSVQIEKVVVSRKSGDHEQILFVKYYGTQAD